MAILLGLVLLLVGGVAVALAIPRLRLWRAIRAVPVHNPAELVAAAGTGPLDRRLYAVVGRASPGSRSLRSTVNLEPCVWHRHTIVQERTRTRTDANGLSRRSTSRRRVVDRSSPEPFTLRETGGSILVHPDNMSVDHPTPGPRRTLPGIIGRPAVKTSVRIDNASGNSYHHREWVIREGTPLYVLGEAVDRGAHVVVRKPPNGPHIVSTRTAAQLLRRTGIAAVAALVLAAATVPTGIVLITVGLI